MTNPILAVAPLGSRWPGIDPFLFCAYHDNVYPRGNGKLGPQASLEGRDIGQDFSGKDGWSMYHGSAVPGFPAHPHRGFETVTIVRKGMIDHSDSLGAAARFGGGDVQWLTTGRGIVHSEMFPLLDTKGENPLELFQIWLNLPGRSKLADPFFKMLWSEQIPQRVLRDDVGRATEVALVAGRFGDMAPPAPPPDSWAAQAEADLAIWTLRMEPGASFRLPPASATQTRRTLYFFKGDEIRIGAQRIPSSNAIEVEAGSELELVAGGAACELLMLQGRPIAEPVAQYGPFVMNSEQELHQAMQDFRATRFGRWSFPSEAPVHGSEMARFARYPDGRLEKP